MSRRGADEVSGSPQLQARLLRPAGPAQMNAVERDRLIDDAGREGLGSREDSGVLSGCRAVVSGMALQRIAEGRPGRVRGE